MRQEANGVCGIGVALVALFFVRESAWYSFFKWFFIILLCLCAMAFLALQQLMARLNKKTFETPARPLPDGQKGVVYPMNLIKPEAVLDCFSYSTMAKLFPINLGALKHFEEFQVEFLDARPIVSHDPSKLSFIDCGFQLMELPDDLPESLDNPDTRAWLRERALELVSHYTKGENSKITTTWAGVMERAGPTHPEKGLKATAVGGAHLDYYQDLDACNAFVASRGGKTKPLSADVILGMWKPHKMSNPVQDLPLFLMDYRSLERRDTIMQKQQLAPDDFNLAAGIRYNCRHKWYWFDNMTEREVLIFTHYTNPKFTNGKIRANPHGAMVLKHPLPDGMETRRSQEERLTISWTG